MSLLFRVVFANECTSTHHRLALDALRHLQDEDADVRDQQRLDDVGRSGGSESNLLIAASVQACLPLAPG